MDTLTAPTWFYYTSLLLVAIGLASRAAMVHRIENKYPEIWEKLLRPKYLDYSWIDKPTRKFNLFFFSGQWLRLKDIYLILYGLTTFLSVVGCLIMFYLQLKWGL